MNSAAALSLIFAGALRGSCLLLAAAAMALALRRSSAAVRHVAWTAGIVALLLVAPLSQFLPVWRIPVSAPIPFAEQLSPSATVSSPSTLSRPALPATWPRATVSGAGEKPPAQPIKAEHQPLSGYALLFTAWTIGTVALAFWFLTGAWRLSRTVRSASPIDDTRIAELAEASASELGVPRSRFRLRWTNHALTPMTWGFLRPFILLPATSVSWSDERLRQVLIHEIGHVQRWDVFTQALSSLACTLYWFNPLVWWAARRMLVERERACDDLVLRSGAAPSNYAHELLEIARTLGAGWTTSRVSTAMARKSQISGRLLAVLDTKRSRAGIRRSAAFVCAVLASAILIPVASLTLRPVPALAAPAPIVASNTTSVIPQPITMVPSEPADALRDARLGIAAAERSWAEALKLRDARALATHYTQDTLLVSAGMPEARGRRAAQQAMQHLIDTGIVSVEVQTLELHPVDNDTVCEVGRITFRQVTGQQVGYSSFMTLWKKEKNEWRIHRDFVTP